MAAPTKTLEQSLIALQSIAANTVVISTIINVATKFRGRVFIQFGRRAAAALTSGMKFRIETSAKAAGDGAWFPYTEWESAITLAEAEPLTAAAAAQNVLSMANTANIVVGNIIYIDNPTIANSEFGRVKAISANVSATIEDNLLNAQASSTIYNQAQMWSVPVDLEDAGRIRLVADGSNTGQAVAVAAWLTTMDTVA